jgi:hypothetical protein
MNKKNNSPLHHEHKTHWVVFLFVSIIVTFFLSYQINKYSEDTGSGFDKLFRMVKAQTTATLSLSPTSTSIGVNQNFNVNINLATGGNTIDGVDIYSLRFNPAILQVVDSNVSFGGVQIAPGSLMNNTVINTVNNSAGTIQFSQSTPGGTSYSEAGGVLATITFRGIASGMSSVDFDFTLGNTNDTNVAYQGVDKLGSVVGGNYTVDGIAPTVSITSPANNSSVSGTVNVNATANDANGVVGVQFRLDGNPLMAEDTSAPYSISWNTTQATNTNHVLTAVARDAAGNLTTSAAVNVTVNNISFDYSLSNGGARTVSQGSSVTNSITATLGSGTSTAVSFSASGLPTGVTPSFSPTSCNPTCSTTLTLNASASAAVGTSTVTVTGNGGGVNKTTSFSLTVNTATFQRTITISALEAKPSKIVSGTLEFLNSSKNLVKSYNFTTNSAGNATITFDIAQQSGFLKIKVAPFLTRVIAVDLSSNTAYVFPMLLIGDINQDNIINSVDYSVLNINWFTSNSSADLNSDGLVNSIDFSFMNKHWLVNGEI